MTAVEHLLYALLWLSFGAAHSLLAADRIKAAVRTDKRPYYRLAYVIAASLHLAVILAVEALIFGDARAFAWPRWFMWLLWGGQVAGWLGLAYVLSRFEMGRFLGLDQAYAKMRGETEMPADDEPLRLDGPYRWVRHPLYSCLLVILWTRVFNEAQLATAAWGSLYLLIGTAFEERKLLARFGDAYRNYRRVVPAFVPWRGRHGPFEGA